MRIKFNPCFARYRQYYSLLATSAMIAQLPYPYLSRKVTLFKAFFGVRAFVSVEAP